MTKGKTPESQKLPRKDPPSNYRPITYLPMMCKIMTTETKEDIYYSLIDDIWMKKKNAAMELKERVIYG